MQKKYQYRDYAGFDCGGIELGIKTWGEREVHLAGEPCVNFLVDDVDNTYQELKAKGVTFINVPEDAQWGARFAIFTDPDGHQLQISQVDWGKYYAACAAK